MRHAPRGYKRTDRISDQIQRDLALMLQRDIKDPRIGMVTISSVKVSKDLSFADIYVTFMDKESEADARDAMKALDSASGFLRSALAKLLSIRVMPKLRFHYDNTIVEGARLDSLIKRALAEDQAHGKSSDAPEEDASN